MIDLIPIASFPISIATVLFVVVAINNHEKKCPHKENITDKLNSMHEDIREIRTYLLNRRDDV